jgi:hypothetical protein
MQGIIAGGLLAFFTANRIIGLRLFSLLPARTHSSGIIQGIFVGGALALITMNLILDTEAKAIRTTTNRWNAILQCNVPGNGILLRAVCAKFLPAANVA